jgi:tRNA pseudouridine32 synthase/23S rRNA pseudouridine746 synthase
MMEGLDVAPPRRFAPPHADVAQLRVVFADAWIVVVDKPAGLLSVPGRGAVPDDSVQAQLRREHPEALLVHRLDLDTSGLLVAARDMPTYVALQRQFLGRTVEKRYAAIVRGEVEAEGGVIDLPIRVDLDDRPRQIHDPVHGRRAVTKWRRDGLVSPPIDGEDLVCTRVRFFPLTGRTHQLRVHAAHPLGLGAPILGDRLYGHTGRRLMLHAEGLTFDHPATGERVSFDSSPPF